MLPSGMVTPWSNRLADLVYLPLVPLGDAASFTRRWFTSSESPLVNPEDVERLVIERNEYRRMVNAANARIEQLEVMVSDLSRVPLNADGLDVNMINARVVGRSTDRISGPVRINAGARRGIREGGIAVMDGDVLVGTIVGEPGSASSFVLPVFGERRLIDGKLELDRSNGSGNIDIQLETVDGGFISSIDQSVDVPIGATVRLNDSAWPLAAQGMRLARVVSREQRRSNPARMDLVFEPIADVNNLGRVVIVVEDFGGAP